MRVSKVVRVWVMAALVALCAVQPRALAQRGMMGGMEMGTQAMSKRSLEMCAKILKMDDAQKESAQSLLEGYRAEHKREREAMQAKMESLQESMRDTGDWQGNIKQMQDVGLAFREKAEGLEKTFLSDVQALLSEEQKGRWADVERFRRRDKGLKFQFYTGAAVDLTMVAERTATVLSTQEYKDLSAQYELEVDRRLQDWEKRGKDAQDGMKKEDTFDMGKQMEAVQTMGEVSKSLRDLNTDYAKRMGALMNEEQRAKFEKAYLERAYPRVYKRTHTQETLDAAAEMKDLTSAQRDQVTTLKAQFEKDLAPMNEAWAKAIVAQEDKAGGMIGAMQQTFGGQGGNEDIKKARDDRKDLESRVTKRLGEVLTPAQKDALPAKKPSNRDPWMDMFNSGEEEEE